VTSHGRRNARHPRVRPLGSSKHDGDGEWLWGVHPVRAALANPARGPIIRLLATPVRTAALAELGTAQVETLSADAITACLPPGAAHQGVALRAPPAAAVPLDDLAQPAAGCLVMLDHITDPQNVGQIFRCAAAFGARGVILQERHAPSLGGTVAKAAAGAVDRLPHVRAVNLSRALERLADLGWRAIGLDGAAEAALAEVIDGGPTVLVLGSEGEGLRRLVREHCDLLARIPMPGGLESLNVAAAAAVALYEASWARTARRGQ
jgi:23S rRNA (guanosine2251-2'-O)-methyltransferase